MKLDAKGRCFICFLLLGWLAAGQAPRGWQEFTSPQSGYIVAYPKTWHLLVEPSLPTLYISNFAPSRRVRGVIVPENGATISIVSSPGGVRDIGQWIEKDSTVSRVKSRNSFALQRPQPQAPLKIVEVTFESIEGPDTESWYFEASGRLLVANLSYWSEDPKAEEYRHVLRGVIGSVRISPRQ